MASRLDSQPPPLSSSPASPVLPPIEDYVAALHTPEDLIEDGKVSAEAKAVDRDAGRKPATKKRKVPFQQELSDGGGILKRVTATSFLFRTDLKDDQARRTHPSGIIHAAVIAEGGREEHAFAWVSDFKDAAGLRGILDYLSRRGFRPGGMRFIPYSSRENWEGRYPHAAIRVECDGDGRVTGDPEWEPEDDAGGKMAAKKRATKKRPPPKKLLEWGRLPDPEREELHGMVYDYFKWLHMALGVMETHTTGRRKVQMAGVSVPALGGLISKLEASFRSLRIRNKEGKKAEAADVDGMNVDSAALPSNGLPFLEKALEPDLRQKVLDNLPAEPSMLDKSSSPQKAGTKKEPWMSLPFDELFRRLVAFREEKGHVRASNNSILGKWGYELRANKKALDDRGLECEPDLSEEGTGAAVSNCRTYLTRSRIEMLNSLEFPWSLLPRVSWDDRFEELKRFKEENGRFPSGRDGAIGNWLKQQRKLHTKNDANFMAQKAPRFEEIGCPLRMREYTTVPWEDRFQQLVEFGRVNRHFNVPDPIPSGEYRGSDKTGDLADRKRFFRFVSKIHAEYRNVQRGLPSAMLTEDRIAALRNIGFEFSLKPAKAVPDIDWSTRMQQLESYQSETGHMRVDPNYKYQSDLGGWAVEVSERHKAWREGQLHLPQEEVERFEELASVGFGFDVFRFRAKRGERSWEDSFELLLRYREETGSCRVPHAYKADSRLGSWVAVQRKEYKFLIQGKPSRMTQERIQLLESVGFEWVARRARDN